MTTLLVAFSMIVAFIGLAGLTRATMGVGFMAGACLLAIFARIAQAHEQHRARVQVEPAPAVEWTPPISTPTPKWQKAAFIGLMVLIVVSIVLKIVWDLS